MIFLSDNPKNEEENDFILEKMGEKNKKENSVIFFVSNNLRDNSKSSTWSDVVRLNTFLTLRNKRAVSLSLFVEERERERKLEE